MQNFDPIITAYVLVVAGLLGLVMGSFINCWAWRSTHGESVLAGRSHCPACGHELRVRDLVPVLSWLLSGRKCRYCDSPVSARYPATELVCAIAFMAIVFVYGLSVETVELLGFTGVLLFLSLTDIDDFIIPNACIVVALAIRAVYLAAAYCMGAMALPDIGYYLASGFGMGIALVVVVLVADKVLGRESMGGGDLKLYAVAGFYFGWQQGLFLVIVSCVLGILVALLTMGKTPAATEEVGLELSGGLEGGEDGLMRRPIPFGPSIAAACVITMLAGNAFISWYLTFL